MGKGKYIFNRSKPYRTVETDTYVFTFFVNERNIGKGRVDGTYLRITSREDRQFLINIPGNTEAFGFLLAASEQDMTEYMLHYVRIVYGVAMLCVVDRGFTEDVCKAMTDWMARRNKEAGKEAAAVTDEQEQVNQTFMEDVARYADAATDKERKYIREGWKEEFVKYIKDGDFTDDI